MGSIGLSHKLYIINKYIYSYILSHYQFCHDVFHFCSGICIKRLSLFITAICRAYASNGMRATQLDKKIPVEKYSSFCLVVGIPGKDMPSQ